MIEIKNITKYFGNTKAVDSLNLKIESGQIVGLLGPNGAGKSTTMRMLCGYLVPDEGEVVIDGIIVDRSEDKIKSRIGYMPESNPLYEDMLVCEFLELTAELRKVKDIQSSIDHVVGTTNLEEVYYKPIGELSKGYRQRVGLASALIGDPEILILDEPTEGLDPNQRAEIRKLVKDMGKERTVIISTHVMQEVEAMCSRVVIMDRGRLIADDEKDKILALQKGASATEIVVNKLTERELEKIATVESVELVSRHESKSRYRIVVSDTDLFAQELSQQVSKLNFTIYELKNTTGSLEDIFYQLTRGGDSK